MVAEGEFILKYMREHINQDKGEVFLLLERKCDAGKQSSKNYNYFTKGNDLEILMSVGEIVKRVSERMGLSFDDAVEVLKNVHLQDKTMIRTRTMNRIDKDWE